MRTLLLASLLTSSGLLAADPAPTPTPPVAPAPAETPFLGLTIDETATTLDGVAGVPVADVRPNTTAASLALEPGDRLLAINGRQVKNPADIKAILAGSKVGDTVTLTFTRHGTEQQVTGPMLAKPKPLNVNAEVDKAQKALDEARELAKAKAREPSLADLLQQLRDVQLGLPRAVAAFKKQYPNGTFDIKISITISSDSTAKDPIEFTSEPPKPTPTPDAAPKQDAPK